MRIYNIYIISHRGRGRPSIFNRPSSFNNSAKYLDGFAQFCQQARTHMGKGKPKPQNKGTKDKQTKSASPSKKRKGAEAAAQQEAAETAAAEEAAMTGGADEELEDEDEA